MRVFTLAAAATLLIVSGSALAQSKQDFRLTNKTGYTIDKVYVAPSKSNDWEEDILGRGTLANGEWVDITFPKKNQVCSYDLKVVYDDNTPVEWYNFDLCEVSKISIFYSKSEDKTWAKYE